MSDFFASATSHAAGANAAGSGSITLNWTNPVLDFSQVVIVRNTATPIADAPTEVATQVVPDSQWERVAAYALDTHPAVRSFVKNSGLGFAIPYLHAGQGHDYLPDFVVQLVADADRHVIVDTKGYDDRLAEKHAAALRWVSAVNQDGRYGHWDYLMLRDKAKIAEEINEMFAALLN